MIQFQCDYNEGCHPLILQRMMETNMEQTVGYGLDPHCDRARQLIREACECPEADVHFLVGGTQTNATVITSVLRPYQCVVAAETGHINVHETGAIEHGGHKVLALPTERGLLNAEQVREVLKAHFDDDSEPEHMVQPGMVYVSYSSEVGTLYTRQQLTDIAAVCHKYGIPLFVDGARLGYGLMSPESDLTLADLARIADVFYIGGTKQGALFGEAVVITNPALKKDFRYHIKQGGGMLAKGRLLGIQFETLFEERDVNGAMMKQSIAESRFGRTLYAEIAQHAIDEAMRIKDVLTAKGYDFLMESPTNQQFPIVSAEQYDTLSKEFLVSLWQRMPDGRIAIRICTSWATKSENVDKLIKVL